MNTENTNVVTAEAKENRALEHERFSSQERFRLWASAASMAMGTPGAFVIALVLIIIWAATGPLFHFSDTWQLVINTATTVVTFLMVFLIQNTQNRDTRAIHLKLDELLRGVKGARTSLVNLESLTDEQLEELQKEFERLGRRTGKALQKVEPSQK